jgi:hypothetical protein
VKKRSPRVKAPTLWVVEEFLGENVYPLANTACRSREQAAAMKVLLASTSRHSSAFTMRVVMYVPKRDAERRKGEANDRP